MTMIKDGTGKGFQAKVTEKNQLTTVAITQAAENRAVTLGTLFNVNTGDITLTDAVKLSLFYIKNNEDSDLVITALRYNFGTNTGGSGDAVIDVVRNPTAGDIITNANDCEITGSNFNFGSTQTLNADTFKGAVGETALSGGSKHLTSRTGAPDVGFTINLGDIILPKGQSLGIDLTPASGTTNQIVQIAAIAYVATEPVA